MELIEIFWTKMFFIGKKCSLKIVTGKISLFDMGEKDHF